MTTKTITIMDDAYRLLADNKVDTESFSDTIRRILADKKKRNLKDFFGILTDKEGEGILNDLEKIRNENIKMIKKRIS